MESILDLAPSKKKKGEKERRKKPTFRPNRILNVLVWKPFSFIINK